MCCVCCGVCVCVCVCVHIYIERETGGRREEEAPSSPPSLSLHPASPPSLPPPHPPSPSHAHRLKSGLYGRTPRNGLRQPSFGGRCRKAMLGVCFMASAFSLVSNPRQSDTVMLMQTQTTGPVAHCNSILYTVGSQYCSLTECTVTQP